VASVARSRMSRRAALRGKPRDLTRDKVVDAALALVDTIGADALTMRGVADAVGVTPMALYNHFSSKRDLLAAIAESVISAAQFDGGHPEWRHQIRHCFDVLRTLCLQHPGLPRLLEFEGTAPASVFAPMDVTVRALRQAGLDDLDSARTYFLLVGFTLAQAAYQSRPVPDLEPSKRIRTDRIVQRGGPATGRLELPAAWDFDASFAFGLSLVLRGIEATEDAVPKPGHQRQTKGDHRLRKRENSRSPK
jgi:TetR/AcrR family transcriptional regulator, tetracycline repressor protein